MPAFTKWKWTKEMLAVQLGGPIRCPKCHVLGFYNPRVVWKDGKAERCYRACKFCGFWQEADGSKAYRCIAVRCAKCGTHDWRHPSSKDLGTCAKCGSDKIKECRWAVDDRHHPFRKWARQISEANRKRKP